MAFAALAGLFAGLVAAAREHGGLAVASDLRFSDDGKFLTGRYGGRLHVWKRREDRYQRLFGAAVFDGFETGTWEIETDDQQRAFIFHTFENSTGRSVITQYGLPFNGGPQRKFAFPSYCNDISIARDGSRFVADMGGVANVYQWSREDPITAINVAGDWTSDTTISPDGAEVLNVGEDSLRIWDSETGKLLRRGVLPADNLHNAAYVKYSPNGKYICVIRGQRFDVFDAATLGHMTLEASESFLGGDTSGWRIWMAGAPSTLIWYEYSADGVLAKLVDVEANRTRELPIPTTRRRDDYWVPSIALSPDEQTCALEREGRIDLIDMATGASTTIFYPRPTIFTIIYSIGFIVWGIVWGRLARSGSLKEDEFAKRERSYGPNPVGNAMQVLGEGMMSLAIIAVLVGVISCMVGSIFGPVGSMFVLAAALPALAFFVYRAEFSVKGVQEVGASLESSRVEDEASKPLNVPSSIVAVWIACGFGGLVAIAAPTAWMLHSGWVWYPFWYYSIIVGVAAIAQAAACSLNRLTLIALLQLGCVLSCDIVNFLIGCGALILLQRGDARDFRRTLARWRAAAKWNDKESAGGR